jgi:hypothetical protein
MPQDQWVLLESFNSEQSAAVVRGMLEQSGIECSLENVMSNRTMPHLATLIPVRLMVRAADLGVAKELLVGVLKEFEESNHKDQMEASSENAMALKGEISPHILPETREKLFRRAYQTAVFGFWVAPGLSGLLACYYLWKFSQLPVEPDGYYPLWKLLLTLGFSFGGFALCYSLLHFHVIF